MRASCVSGTASSPSGDVELVPSLTSFKSSEDKVLKVAENTGKFATGMPGNASVIGSHVAAKDPAKKDFRVCYPAKARLVFDPASARLTILPLSISTAGLPSKTWSSRRCRNRKRTTR